MDKYLVVSPHTEKDCAATLKQMLYIGYITHFIGGSHDSREKCISAQVR